MICKLCGSGDNVDYSISYGSYLCTVCESMWKKAINKVLMPEKPSLFNSNDKPKILSAKNKLKKLAYQQQRVG